MSQCSEFCRHNPLCCFSMSVYCYCRFRYRFSLETFGYTFVCSNENNGTYLAFTISEFILYIKVKLSLCFFNWAPRHEGVLGEWMYSSTHSLTSALNGGEWSASCPGRFNPREGDPGTHWIGGWVGPRAGLDAMVKIKIPKPHRESNPRTPIVQLVAQRYTDWAIWPTDRPTDRPTNQPTNQPTLLSRECFISSIQYFFMA
jgi:hypothetical protein